MLSVVKSVGIIGLNGYVVDVEVDISGGLPGFDIVGLPDTSVKESKERVRAAIKNSGFEFPIGRITVNLAPADLRKEGPVFDLAVAVALLAASGQISGDNYKNHVILGELSLDGTVRSITGVLPSVLSLIDNSEIKGVIVPFENADEAALAVNVKVLPSKNLKEVAGFLNGKHKIGVHTINLKQILNQSNQALFEDISEVLGHSQAKRALEVAAAGGHNVIMIGPPGSGKTMLARRLAYIMPDMSFDEALDVTKIYSVSGLLKDNKPLVTARPFRSPHHNISKSGMVGGGNVPRPGEISLAHHGILFMDEFPEFSKDTLESLRQPLEDGRVCISRVNGNVEYPARTMLVGAMNPCPCGYYGDDTRECSCTPLQVSRYRNRVSGPLLDRMDICIQVPRIKYRELQDRKSDYSSLKAKNRINKARQVQRKRFEKKRIWSNAEMGTQEVREYCKISGKSAVLMKEAFDKLNLSARAYTRILKVARTIADLEGKEDINENHIAEAIQYRSLDRSY